MTQRQEAVRRNQAGKVVHDVDVCSVENVSHEVIDINDIPTALLEVFQHIFALENPVENSFRAQVRRDLLPASLMDVQRELREWSRQADFAEVLADPFQAFSVQII